MDTSTSVALTMAMIRRSLEKVDSREDIISFIQQLADERDNLQKRQEHMSSLLRLFERTVSDADDMAAQIKSEAMEQAQAKAQELLREAEGSARQMLEDARAKVTAETENEVRALRENAERTLQGVLEEQVARCEEHVKQAAQRLYEEMVAQAEESKRQLEAFRVDSAEVLAAAWVNLPPAGVPVTETASEAAPPVETPAAPEEKECESVLETPPTEPVGAKSRTKAPRGESTEAVKDVGAEREPVDIVILPPRDKLAMESIRKFLDSQDEVAAVNVEHMTDRTLIQVRLARPMNVAERLSGLSDVERVQTITEGSKTKIQVILSVRNEIERERSALDFRAKRIASRVTRGR